MTRTANAPRHRNWNVTRAICECSLPLLSSHLSLLFPTFPPEMEGNTDRSHAPFGHLAAAPSLGLCHR